MTLVLETGFGVQDANSYVTAAFVTTYLTDRGREAENGWSGLSQEQQEEKCIAATDYIDNRWGNRFKSVRKTRFAGNKAEARATFSAQPADGETVVLGSYTYTFRTALSSLTADFEVLIGASAAETAQNLVYAITENTTDGASTFSTNVLLNQAAWAEIDSTTDTQVNLVAQADGTAGNDIPLSTTAVNITLIMFVNGRDFGSQPLEFPRAGLTNRSGILVTGIPLDLKQATAEYAVRAVANELFQDPTIDPSGRAVTSEKLGPIQTDYADGGAIDYLIRPYPAADQLLRDYITSAGVTR
ncbi:gp75 [Alphaproteobacteria phage PhiJL001]|uniref:Gp75 n=1 Tax=Alphaproteobacteria phage PhiJL001 TaxID=2681607 RepID=Q5DN30_9CAUD|nr:head-tail adaptor Ad1 [Alphaproteobacteria phage PhiJL001]AAT69473.1 gp75 [Alphaproteobacteria phage PhiJL001]